MKIAIVGTEHMAQSFSYCLERIGHKIVGIEESDVCWIAIDTPISKDGRGDIKIVFDAVKKISPKLKDNVLVICSSQIPVGTSQELIKILGDRVSYAYIPEHMRMGRGIFEQVGADVTDVTHALRSDWRIGKEAYLDVSVGFRGGHFDRDLNYLQDVAKEKKVDIPIIDAVKEKNYKRRERMVSKLIDL